MNPPLRLIPSIEKVYTIALDIYIQRYYSYYIDFSELLRSKCGQNLVNRMTVKGSAERYLRVRLEKNLVFCLVDYLIDYRFGDDGTIDLQIIYYPVMLLGVNIRRMCIVHKRRMPYC